MGVTARDLLRAAIAFETAIGPARLMQARELHALTGAVVRDEAWQVILARFPAVVGVSRTSRGEYVLSTTVASRVLIPQTHELMLVSPDGQIRQLGREETSVALRRLGAEVLGNAVDSRPDLHALIDLLDDLHLPANGIWPPPKENAPKRSD